ncbi:MAG: hypothetical protein LBC18_01160 [Opitutaceae bacterium]|jgi:hypothetical protein|nr:hypothetical protein [Opitutaceae bacterium]
MKTRRLTALLAAAGPSAAGPDAGAAECTLAGVWQLSLDPATTPGTLAYPDTIHLPGTLEEAGKGQPAAPNTIELNRRFIHNGTAWYQRTITIPGHWRGKRIELLLERTRFTEVHLDGRRIAAGNSLSTPHRATLPDNAAPGDHRLTIAVNNDPKNYPMNFSHVWSDRIQTNWNGILGDIKLIARDPVSITETQLHPDLKNRTLKIQLAFANATPAAAAVTLSTQINRLGPASHALVIPPGRTTRALTIPLPEDLPLWDEFSPALHELQIQLADSSAPPQTIRFGLREFSRQNKKFVINGTPAFLRGRLDSGLFPLTGYASMNEADWLRRLSTAQSYGINYIRFHSWCPPEAAFAAADKLGLYLQPELPAWSRFDSPGLPEYLQSEALAILREFGNHPSFVMLTLGNELTGDNAGRRRLVQQLKDLDPRRLYAQGSNNAFDTLSEPNDNDDFWAASATFREGGRVVLNIELLRGSMLYSHLGHLNNQYPCATTHDYTRSTARSPVPLISHETGQYLIYPDFTDIPKYTGILDPNPMRHHRRLLEKSGMAALAEKFHHASGRLAALCYKEDIESVLRTPGIGGFALLDLQDYTGQGSASVGLCNPFMEPKKFLAPEQFRAHNAPVTPLLLLPKRTLAAGEPLAATLKIAHYHNRPLSTRPLLTLAGAGGEILHQQKLPPVRGLPPGALHTIAENISIPLSGIAAPARLTLRVQLENTPWRNEYDLWLYPEKTAFRIPKNIELTERLDPAALRRLRNGATLLVLPRLHELAQSIEGQFIANFWTVAFFKSYDGPGTLGLLLDPAHPLFKHFPTESHSNWQWFPMTRHGRPMILDRLPPRLRPLIQVIDNFETSRKLGLLFEARCGRGRLIFTSINFLSHLDKPEVRQLLFSILRYIESPDFAPEVEVAEAQLQDLFRQPAAAPDYESAQRPGLNG